MRIYVHMYMETGLKKYTNLFKAEKLLPFLPHTILYYLHFHRRCTCLLHSKVLSDLLLISGGS